MIKRYPVDIGQEKWFMCMSDIPYCDIQIVGDETKTLYNTVLEKTNEPNEYIEIAKENFNENPIDYLENRNPDEISKDDLKMALAMLGIYL